MPRQLISKKSIRKFKRFHGHAPEKVKGVVFTMPKNLDELGAALDITYLSDKSNGPHGRKHTPYRHKFGAGVKVYGHPDGKWLLISGGKFKITDWLRN